MNSELRKFFDTTLRQKLRDLESMRERCMLLAAFGIIAAFVAVITGLYYKGVAVLITVIPLGIAGLLFYKAYEIWHQYKLTFKQNIVKSLIRFVDADWEYFPTLKIPKDTFEQSEFWDSSIDKYKGDDLIRGKINDIDFECSELCVLNEDAESTEGRWSLIFQGLFFHADLQKKFLGKTFILSNRWWDGILGREDYKAPLVEIEQPDFEGAFDVHSTNSIEARYLLTTKMMEAILSLKEKYKGLRLSFVGSSVYGAIDFEEDLFNPRILRSGVEFDDVVAMYDLIKIAEDIIRELYVNTKDLVSLDDKVLDEKVQIRDDDRINLEN